MRVQSESLPNPTFAGIQPKTRPETANKAQDRPKSPEIARVFSAGAFRSPNLIHSAVESLAKYARNPESLGMRARAESWDSESSHPHRGLSPVVDTAQPKPEKSFTSFYTSQNLCKNGYTHEAHHRCAATP